MNERLLKTFFDHQNDNKNPLYMGLDCWEQVIYNALKPYNLDCKYIFVRDIYPVFTYGNSSWSLVLPENDLNQSIYEVEPVDFSRCGPCSAIENTINQNEFVIIHTAFDLVPAYDKKELSVFGRTHYSIIVGYDDLHFYVIDNPFMFVKSKNVVHPKFTNISIIEKRVMNEAFEKKCELKTMKINVDSLTSINRLDCLMKRIVDTFYSEKTLKNGDYALFYGRQAFIKLIEILENSGSECLDNSFLNNHHNAHLLYSCRLILKWCLQEDMRYQGSAYFQDVLNNLNLSLAKWQIVKMMIAKNNAQAYPDFLKKLKERILIILEIEEKFIESVSKLRSS